MPRRSLKAYLRCPGAKLASPRAAGWRFRRDQRGGIALITAICLVPLTMMVGIGIEVSNWALVKAELQRTVDLAAIAGAKEYLLGSNTQNAVNAAADVAELNGASGGILRIWNPANQLLTDNQITAQAAAGTQARPTLVIKVIANQAVPRGLTAIMGDTSPVILAATAWADASISVQPCILALDPGGTGVTAQGSASINLTGCSVRSNSVIATGGAATMSASAFYANGSITGSETGGPVFPNDGTIPDPYAHYAPVQNAISAVGAANGPALSDKPGSITPLVPGSWSMWDIKGNVTLSPGIYYIAGDISLGAQASISGIGVTIVTSGSVSMRGGSTVTLSAATPTSAVNRAIPGVVFIGSSTSASTFLGNTGIALTGVVYNPNGALDFGGTAQSGSTGCLEVIAKSVQLKGNPSMASNCSIYGVISFPSETPTSALTR